MQQSVVIFCIIDNFLRQEIRFHIEWNQFAQVFDLKKKWYVLKENAITLHSNVKNVIQYSYLSASTLIYISH